MTAPSRRGSPVTSEWQAYTPAITGSITNPTKSTSHTLIARYKVVGKSLHIAVTYYAPASAGSNAGSGAYSFSLPPGYSINTAVAPIISSPTSLQGDFSGATASTLGYGSANSGTASGTMVVVGTGAGTVGLYAVNVVNVSGSSGTGGTMVGSVCFSIGTSNCLFKFTAEIPIL